MRLRSLRKDMLLFVVFALGLVGARAHAGDTDLPLALQAVLFKKIIAYDQTLDGKADPKVVIVHADDATEDAENVLKAFKSAGHNVAITKVAGLAAALNGAAVLYVHGAVPPTAYKDLCAKQQVLAVSGAGSHAVSGDVAIGLGTKADGKPEIIVNLGVMKAEGHRMSSALLSLARVIQ